MATHNPQPRRRVASPAAALRCVTGVLLLLLLCVAPQPASARMYCGEDNCYHVLGVLPDAESGQVRRAYRDLAKRYHPDKNAGPGREAAAAMFVAVAEAYEVLSDDELRASYDYYLAHPEERVGNRYRYFRAKYKIPVWVVLVGAMVVFSVLKHAAQHAMWRRAVRYFASQPEAAGRVYRLAYREVTGEEPDDDVTGAAPPPQTKQLRSRKKGKRGAAEAKKKQQQQQQHAASVAIPPEVMERARAEIVKDIGDNITGGYAKPTWRTLCAVQLVLLPWRVLQYLKWCVTWWYKFDFQKQPYGEAEKLYLTQRIIKRGLRASWTAISPEQQEDFLARELWADHPARFKALKAELQEAAMAKKPSLYKRYARLKKQGRVS